MTTAQPHATHLLASLILCKEFILLKEQYSEGCDEKLTPAVEASVCDANFSSTPLLLKCPTTTASLNDEAVAADAATTTQLWFVNEC